jgi:hypothetical protein
MGGAYGFQSPDGPEGIAVNLCWLLRAAPQMGARSFQEDGGIHSLFEFGAGTRMDPKARPKTKSNFSPCLDFDVA